MTESADALGRRVVVGVDGSPHSEHALRWAGHFAALYGATLEVVTAWEYPAGFGWEVAPTEWDPAADMRTVAEGVISTVFGGQPPAATHLHVREGGAAKVLLDVSEGATMLVVGSRGHGGFTGMLLGSVSASVAEHASCPVLIMHGNEPPPPLHHG